MDGSGGRTGLQPWPVAGTAGETLLWVFSVGKAMDQMCKLLSNLL